MRVRMTDGENSFFISDVAKITKGNDPTSYCALAKWEVTFRDGTSKKFSYDLAIAEVEEEL